MAVIAKFSVTTQVLSTGQGRDGVFTRGYTVQGRLESGTTFEMFIPLAEYNVANVKSALQGLANEVYAVEQIGH